MLTRLYVDNYKCLVNFDLRLGKQHLLMGKNGAGKTTVFEVLGALKRIASGEAIGNVLSISTLTRWQRRSIQQFEVEAVIDEQSFRYVLRADLVARTIDEDLWVEGASQFVRRGDEIVAGQIDKILVIERDKAALSALPSRFSSRELNRFRKWWSEILIVRMDPRRMSAETEEESSSLDEGLSEFASWFRHMAQQQLGAVTALNRALQEVLEGFDSLSLPVDLEMGVRLLKSTWRLDAKGTTQTVDYAFDELSEGQRALIGLYSLMYFAPAAGTTLCLDEPDNFVALREIQPFLLALRERENIQSLIISHHPEVINLLAPESGLMFERVAGGPARVEPFRAPPDAALPPAELIARGWEDGK